MPEHFCLLYGPHSSNTFYLSAVNKLFLVYLVFPEVLSFLETALFGIQKKTIGIQLPQLEKTVFFPVQPCAGQKGEMSLMV